MPRSTTVSLNSLRSFKHHPNYLNQSVPPSIRLVATKKLVLVLANFSVLYLDGPLYPAEQLTFNLWSFRLLLMSYIIAMITSL